MTAGGTALHCYGDNNRMSDKHLTTDFSPAEACWQHNFPDLHSTCGSTELLKTPCQERTLSVRFWRPHTLSGDTVLELANSHTTDWRP